MKNRRRFITVIVTLLVLFSISMPVLGAYVFAPSTKLVRGFYRYSGSTKQEQFKQEGLALGGDITAAVAWKTSSGSLVRRGSYVFISDGTWRQMISGWVDYPTSYTPNGLATL